MKYKIKKITYKNNGNEITQRFIRTKLGLLMVQISQDLMEPKNIVDEEDIGEVEYTLPRELTKKNHAKNISFKTWR